MLCTAVGELNTLVVFFGIRYPEEFGALSLYAAHRLALHIVIGLAIVKRLKQSVLYRTPVATFCESAPSAQ